MQVFDTLKPTKLHRDVGFEQVQRKALAVTIIDDVTANAATKDELREQIGYERD